MQVKSLIIRQSAFVLSSLFIPAQALYKIILRTNILSAIAKRSQIYSVQLLFQDLNVRLNSFLSNSLSPVFIWGSFPRRTILLINKHRYLGVLFYPKYIKGITFPSFLWFVKDVFKKQSALVVLFSVVKISGSFMILVLYIIRFTWDTCSFIWEKHYMSLSLPCYILNTTTGLMFQINDHETITVLVWRFFNASTESFWPKAFQEHQL